MRHIKVLLLCLLLLLASLTWGAGIHNAAGTGKRIVVLPAGAGGVFKTTAADFSVQNGNHGQVRPSK
jgi:hypothetical protein